MGIIEITGTPEINIHQNIKELLELIFKNNVLRMSDGQECTPICMLQIKHPGQEKHELMLMPFQFGNADERRALQSQIYRECLQKDVLLACFVADMWMTRSDDPDYLQKHRPMDDPDRKESLNIIIMAPDGRTNILTGFYNRMDDNKCVFPESVSWRGKDIYQNGFFIPPWRGEKETMH